MKTFQSTRKFFDILGVCSRSEKLSNLSHIKKCVIFLLFTQYSITLTSFLLFEANTFNEYADSFYAVATSSLLFFTLTEIVRKKTQIFHLIDNYERIIQKRNKKKNRQINFNVC